MKGEVSSALVVESQRRRTAEAKKKMVWIALSPRQWEDRLHDLCLNWEDQRLVIDLVRWLKIGVSERKPMQVLVIRSLVSKLKRNNNHHYVYLVKDRSGLFKIQLGPSYYALLADMFGLARETTASKHASQLRLDPGLNKDSIDLAPETFKGLPINEASDGARCLHYVEPRKLKDKHLVLVGHTWDPNADTWPQNVNIPRKDVNKNDSDDFDAMKRFTDNLTKDENLAKTVSIHNFTALASLEKPTVIICMWPSPDHGYSAKHLLKYWERLRKVCYYDSTGNVRKTPLNLIGFSLRAAVQLMTPTAHEIQNGVLYLGLGIDDEMFASPYYWHLRARAHFDYNHEQRLFLKNFKYVTRDLSF